MLSLPRTRLSGAPAAFLRACRPTLRAFSFFPVSRLLSESLTPARKHDEALCGSMRCKGWEIKRKSRRRSSAALVFCWCPGGDSNSHAIRRYHLKIVCLPIPPPGHELQLIENRRGWQAFFCRFRKKVALSLHIPKKQRVRSEKKSRNADPEKALRPSLLVTPFRPRLPRPSGEASSLPSVPPPSRSSLRKNPDCSRAFGIPAVFLQVSVSVDKSLGSGYFL